MLTCCNNTYITVVYYVSLNSAATPQPRNSPYRRVRAEAVKVDPRLADNSYEAKASVTGSNFGARANQVLKQVKGRDFRHEKTKKKRGTYSGGQIDMGVNSVRFDSD